MECPGATKCSHGDVCFAERARKRANEADVLVVNHALYCVHLDSSGAVLPEHDLVIFDEAHGLADVATTTFGIDVTPTGLRQLASRLTGVGVARTDADPLGLAADALTRAIERGRGSGRPHRGRVRRRARRRGRAAGRRHPVDRREQRPERRRPDQPARGRPAGRAAPAARRPTPTRSCGSSATRSTSRRSTCPARSRRDCSRPRPRCSPRRPSAAAPASRPSPAGSASIPTPRPVR